MKVNYKINNYDSNVPEGTSIDLVIKDLNGHQLDAIRIILVTFMQNNTLFSEQEKKELSLDVLITALCKPKI